MGLICEVQELVVFTFDLGAEELTCWPVELRLMCRAQKVQNEDGGRQGRANKARRGKPLNPELPLWTPNQEYKVQHLGEKLGWSDPTTKPTSLATKKGLSRSFPRLGVGKFGCMPSFAPKPMKGTLPQGWETRGDWRRDAFQFPTPQLRALRARRQPSTQPPPRDGYSSLPSFPKTAAPQARPDWK